MSDFPIIDKLGGRQAVFEYLRKQAPDEIKTVDALRMWSSRGQIPGWAQPLLMAAADDARIRYTAADFQLPEPEPAAARQRRRSA